MPLDNHQTWFFLEPAYGRLQDPILIRTDPPEIGL